MKERFYLFVRNRIFYIQDGATGKQSSLKTRNFEEAQRMLHAKKESVISPTSNIAMARVYLSAHDPKMLNRTWQDVINEFCTHGKPETQENNRRVANRKPQSQLRNLKLIETKADDFLHVLKTGGVMTNYYLRCLHNLALGLGWLPWPILTPKFWPSPKIKPKRAITQEEQERIVAAEQNQERRNYYMLLWETGAAQTDAAMLCDKNIDWQNRVLSYQRKKTGTWAHLQIGRRFEELLRLLPSKGLLFPKISTKTAKDRAAEFRRRCRILKIEGVSLHSYRYAWVQRARASGYPLRWAQNALGHDSEAVHQSYAGGGVAVCPSLEEYETKASTVRVE